jgi:hypothetical protein
VQAMERFASQGLLEKVPETWEGQVCLYVSMLRVGKERREEGVGAAVASRLLGEPMNSSTNPLNHRSFVSIISTRRSRRRLGGCGRCAASSTSASRAGACTFGFNRIVS